MYKKMYKKIFLYSIFIFSLFFIFKTSAFLSEDLWEDLYKKLDKATGELEVKMFIKEITSNWTKKPYEVLNKYADTTCFWEKTEISQWKVTDIKELFWYIKDECKDKDWNMSIEKYIKYNNSLNNFINKNKQKAKEKTDKIYEISRIWIYSDWTTKNSPFDLIFDLQEIDKIIFWEDLKYEWENLDFLEKYKQNPINNLLNKDNKKVEKIDDKKNIANIKDIENIKTESEKDEELKKIIIENQDWNNYSCINFSNDSWLNKDELLNFFTKNNNYSPFINIKNTDISINNTSNINNNLELDNKNILNPTWYKKENDNSFWPCNDFFCINIDFIFYTQELLWYWDTKSIKNILEVSNWHLKKIINTSLSQAKQATNNFELSLYKINLSNIFYMWVQIDTKPVPFLNLKDKITSKPKSKENQNFELQKQLNFYYKNLWINPNRVNDLSIYREEAKDRKNIIDFAWTTNYKQTLKEKIDKEKELTLKRADNTSDNIINNQILIDFNNQFSELEIFTQSLWEYSNNTYEIAKAMKNIPINKE